MNIGFDLDKVFINTPPFIPKTFIDKLYKKRDNGILLYRIPGRTEQIIRSLSHAPILRAGMRENLQFLKSLPKNTHKLYLISSRFKFLENKTKKLVKKHHFDKIFDEMYFNFANEQPHIFKNRIIRNLKLDYYIDDDLSLLNYVAAHNPKTIFFWLTPKKTHNTLLQNISPLFPLSEFTDRIKSPYHNLQTEAK
jgi:hypothetical protein